MELGSRFRPKVRAAFPYGGGKAIGVRVRVRVRVRVVRCSVRRREGDRG